MSQLYCKVRRAPAAANEKSCTAGTCELSQNEFVDICKNCGRTKTVGRELMIPAEFWN
jgi:hypothetical protein